MSKNKIPKGWINCPKNADSLIASKFMAIKTPLDSRYHNKLRPSEYFPPDGIFSKARRNNVKIGLWIDLTNTDRYYFKEDIKKQDCIYVKINCGGHGEIPNNRDVNRFISVVHDFTIKSPHECIVVHCTHGLNRTGFMIISFLVRKLNYNIKQAFDAFTTARPPGMYRENYVEELFKCYGGRSQPPPPLQHLPIWCQELQKKDSKKKYKFKNFTN